MGPRKDKATSYTLVCGHLSDRIRLSPEPHQSPHDDLKTRLQHLNLTNGDHASGNGHTSDMQTDSESEKNDSTGSELAVKRKRKETILRLLQRQTLANQGAVLATDLSIIGFMNEAEIQSPPVISRHWITLERPQEQDAVAAEGPVKEATVAPPLPPPQTQPSQLPPPPPPAMPTGPVDPRTFKVEDQLAATLFPETSHHPQPSMPFLPPTASAFQQRPPPFHQQQHPPSQPNFYGLPGVPHMPNMPPTSLNSSLIQGSPATAQQQQLGKFPDVKVDLGSKSQESKPQLFTTLYQALEKESMVAIVALQYPEKQCIKARRLRREKEQALRRGPVQGAAFGSPVPTFLSSDPGSSSSSPTFGHTSNNSTALSAKDDPILARAAASLPPAAESDREWIGILMAGSRYHASQLHTAPIYPTLTADLESDADRLVLLILPRNTTRPSAPWLPDFNRDTPYLLPKYVEVLGFPRSRNTQLLLSENDLPESKVVDGMEAFGYIRKRLKHTKQLLSFLTEATVDSDELELNAKMRQVVAHYNSILAVSHTFGHNSGLDAITKMLTGSLRVLEDKSTASNVVLREIRTLLNILHVDKDYGAGSGATAVERPASPVKVAKETTEPVPTVEVKPKKKPARESPVENVTKQAVAPVKVLKPSQRAFDDDDEEGPDEDLGGGSVRVRNVPKVERALPGLTSLSGQKDGSTSEVHTPKETPVKPSPQQSPQPQQNQGSMTDLMDHEQDTVMEQSKPTRASRSTAAAKLEALELSIHKDIVTEGQSESQLLSPGAPHKRRRDIQDEGSEDGSTFESDIARAPSQTSAPATTPTQPEETAPVTSAKKPIKKTKRLKAEPFDEGRASSSPMVLSDEGEGATSNTGRLKPESATTPTRSVSPAQPPQDSVAPPAAPKTRTRQKQTKAVEQQQKEQVEEPKPDLTPRTLPPPTFVSQHQRTPSGTPQWLAVNSTPSLINNIKGPGRPKKPAATATAAPASTAQQPQQPHQQLQQPYQQPQQHSQQPPQQPPHPQQQQPPHLQHQPQQHLEPSGQRQKPTPVQQAPAIVKEEQHYPGYAQEPHSRSQGVPGYYAGQAPMDYDMQHRRSVEGVVEVPDPRHSGHDPSSMRMQHTTLAQEQPGYPSRTHTPPSHERNASASFPSSQTQHSRYDPRQETSHQQHGSGSSAHQRHASASGMPAVADQGMEAQYRRVEDPRQRQHGEFQENPRFAQKQPVEHPESMRQAPPQDSASRQRQQEWGYAADSPAQYSSPSGSSSRASAHYGGQGAPQEHPGHGHPSHYPTGGLPPQSSHMQQQQQQSSQYYQGQEREHLQHPEPMVPVPTAKKTKATSKTKVQAVPKQQQEDDEHSLRYQASYEQQQQQNYQQQQMQQQQQVQHRQEQPRHYSQQAPQHMTPLQQQQGMQVQYAPPGSTPPLPGRRSGQHSRNNSGSGHPGMMMMNPVLNPHPPSMDQAATVREHSMRRNSPGPGPAGYEYHHSVQTHSRSRGSSPSLTGYSSSHGPQPIPGPVVAGGPPRQGTHSRNSSGYEMASTRGQVQDPYMATSSGRSSVSSASVAAGHYPPQTAPQHHGQSHSEHPSSSMQQQQAYGRHSQQDLRAAYGHTSSRSQDLSSLAAAQQGHSSRSHDVTDVYQQHGQHPSQQQHVQYQAAHRPAEGQRVSSSPASSRASERQWYQESQQEQQHYSQQLHPSQQQHQQGYASHGGHQYHPSQGAAPPTHHGYPSSGGQGMYQQSSSSSDSRYPPPPQQGGPPPSGHPDPNQGPPPGPVSGSSGGGSGSGGGGSRISLSSLLN